METATSMACNLTTIERVSTRKFPIFHFGLIKFEKRMAYVAGGFSRVYFGYIATRKVALKMLFAIELCPSDVQEFYKEAATLDQLRHPNIIEIIGVCVMPPALTLVLEYCKYGSLFEFLYNAKPKKKKKRKTLREQFRQSMSFSMAPSEHHSFAPTQNPMYEDLLPRHLTHRSPSPSPSEASAFSIDAGSSVMTGTATGTGTNASPRTIGDIEEQRESDFLQVMRNSMSFLIGGGDGNTQTTAHNPNPSPSPSPGSVLRSGAGTPNFAMWPRTPSNVPGPSPSPALTLRHLSTATNNSVYLKELEMEYEQTANTNTLANSLTTSAMKLANSFSGHGVDDISVGKSSRLSETTGGGGISVGVSDGGDSSTIMPDPITERLNQMLGFDSMGHYETDGMCRPSLQGKPAPPDSRAQRITLENRMNMVSTYCMMCRAVV